jgi:hypothetical protein
VCTPPEARVLNVGPSSNCLSVTIRVWGLVDRGRNVRSGMIDLDYGPCFRPRRRSGMTRKSIRNYSLSVVAASVASAAILALLVAAALKLG